jgi:hypothetical protein
MENYPLIGSVVFWIHLAKQRSPLGRRSGAIYPGVSRHQQEFEAKYLAELLLLILPSALESLYAMILEICGYKMLPVADAATRDAKSGFAWCYHACSVAKSRGLIILFPPTISQDHLFAVTPTVGRLRLILDND